MGVRKHWGLCLAGAVLLAAGSVACGSDSNGSRRGGANEGGAGGFGGSDLPVGGVGGGAGLLGVGGTGGLLGVGGAGGVLGVGGAGGLLGAGGSIGGTGGGLGTGGAVGAGGASGNGGALGAGGAFGTGGALGAGGAFGTGGALGAGGAFGTGGALGAGGSGGAIGGTGGAGGAGSVEEKDALCPAELTGVVDVYKTAEQNPIDCVEKNAPVTVRWTWEVYNGGSHAVLGVLADDMGGGPGVWVCPSQQPAVNGTATCTLHPVLSGSPPPDCTLYVEPGTTWSCTASYPIASKMKATFWHHSAAIFLGQTEGGYVCGSEADNVHVIKCKKDGGPTPL